MHRIDLMCDIETLGREYNPPVFQIACVPFSVTVGEVLDFIPAFNETCSIKGFHNIEGDTLDWWLNTNPELLKTLISTSSKSEKALIESFNNYILGIAKEYANTDEEGNIVFPEIYLWGNGILFDNRILKEKFESYGLKYPIKYRNDRDMRTIVELASQKLGMGEWEYRSKFFSGTAHNAIDDVISQIKVVLDAWKVLTKE